MNRTQRRVMLVAAVNLAVIMLFPPYDYVSMLLNNIPTFDGFYFILSDEPHRVINASFLTLEVFVVMANAGIALLLLRSPENSATDAMASNSRQRKVLALVAINLVLIILFPPFETYNALTKATLPSFEGFRFVFGDNPMRQINTPILFIEVALVIINGALFWLLFRSKTASERESDRMRELAQKVEAARKR